MPNAIKNYVRYIDAINRRVGKFALYLVFVMIGILLFSSISRTFFNTPHLWTMETAQFTMAAYYMLGGGYSLLLRAHVRMDVFYERWSSKKRATVDTFTSVFLIFYLVILLYGAISSTHYAIEYGQRNYSSWGPPMAPIKIIMTIGIILMLLQAIATFFKDLAKMKGKEI
ncbi:MAG: TRAP transporter small permease subunit [Desulfobacula sp.]|uniref:TRAP transporter small permease subunit n=1 Tax=Desulfobacula sp. TaxID=2593537 RepID=UPI0025C0EB0E|nr:TRAP transporter small permease subunit [Desulfobacula sp.]MCD4722162.1 TRAP transporter small permease subunit [Desulfobacula sp.]